MFDLKDTAVFMYKAAVHIYIYTYLNIYIYMQCKKKRYRKKAVFLH